MDKSLCEFVKKIEADPTQKITGMSVGKLYALQQHLTECQDCSMIVDAILEKYKDVPDDLNSAWNKTKYN